MKDQHKQCDGPVRPFEMDEILETIWTQREKGKNSEAELLLAAKGVDLNPSEAKTWLTRLVDENFATLKEGTVLMTREGEQEARSIIRRHRLAERLFADAFNTSEEVWEKEACELEHESVLTADAVTAVCAFLGHPPTCPHGRPIPTGSCCAKFTQEIKPFVIPLKEARLSDLYRIVFITPKKQNRLEKLSSLGILPGSNITLHQKKPAYVMRHEETEIALDAAIVEDIYVKRVE